MQIVAGDGVAGIKRRRHDLYSDGVGNLAMASGRGQLKEDLESLMYVVVTKTEPSTPPWSFESLSDSDISDHPPWSSESMNEKRNKRLIVDGDASLLAADALVVPPVIVLDEQLERPNKRRKLNPA
ncbi:hypothetical protein Tco_0882438 [Tanacetum coccineum]